MDMILCVKVAYLPESLHPVKQVRKSSMDQTEQIYRCIKSFKQKYGYAPPFRHIAYKLNLRESDVKQVVDSLKRHGRIVVTGGVAMSFS